MRFDGLRPLLRGVVSGLIALSIGSPAAAQVADISPFATLETTYDSNVFRVRDAAEARAQSPAGSPRLADAFATATVGLTGELEPGLQRFIATGQLSRSTYQTFDRLDHTAYRAVAGWSWQYRRLADGEIGLDIERQLQDYGGSEDSNAAFTLMREYRVGGGVNVTPRWRGDLELRANTRRTTDGADTAFDLDQYTIDIAGFYRGDPVARLGLGLAHTIADYPRRQAFAGGVLADEYDETTLEVRLEYSPSGISSVDAALGYTRTEQRPVANRDIDGITGRLAYRRRISGRTQVQLRGYRRVRPAAFENANLVIDSGLVGRLQWSWSVKTNVALEVERRRLDYQDQGNLAAGGQERQDDQSLARLEISWQPLERLGFVLTGEYEDVDSNQNDEIYDASIVSLAMRVGY